MPATMADHRITDADLERWVRDGLITADQRNAIRSDLAARGAAEGGLTATTLLYYGGGLLVLLAYSVFLGLQWEELSPGGRVAISALSLAFFGAASYVLLRTGRFQLPGELLQVVAVAIVPLLAFAVLDATGIWPEEPSDFLASAREQYQADLTWARMALAGATLVVALAAFRWSRSPFVLGAVAISIASLILDASIALQPAREEYTWETPQALLIAGVGAAVLAGGVASRGRTERDYSLWLYAMGLAGLAVGLGNRAFSTDAPAWGALWMFGAVLVLAASIPLQQRLFAAAGLAAVFAYLSKLVFEVFESANAALILAALGLLIVGAGMLYQRFSERLFARPHSG